MEFLAQNQLYIVLIVVLVIWTGLFIYLYRLDSKLSELEKAVKTPSPDGNKI